MQKQSNSPDFNKYLRFTGAPFILIVAPIFGYFAGNWLDHHFGTSPYLTYICLLLGVISGIREFYKLIKSIQDNDSSNS